jgi:hypothetical protein
MFNVANQSQSCLSHPPQSPPKQYHALPIAPTVPGAKLLPGAIQNTQHKNRCNRGQQQSTPSHGTHAKNPALHAGTVLGAVTRDNIHYTSPTRGLQAPGHTLGKTSQSRGRRGNVQAILSDTLHAEPTHIRPARTHHNPTPRTGNSLNTITDVSLRETPTHTLATLKMQAITRKKTRMGQ